MDSRDRFYGFSLLFNIFAEKKTYYAGIMLDAISNLRLTSASTDFRDMSRSPGSVKTTLIFEHFLLFRVFRLSRYLSYL